MAALLATALLAGCSPSSPGGSEHGGAGLPDAVAIPEADIDSYSLPLDSFLVRDDAVLYARDLFIQDCLGVDGIEYPIVQVNLDGTGPATVTEHGVRIFNVDIAHEYGYHNAPTDRFDRGVAIETIERANRVALDFPAEVASCVDASINAFPFSGTPRANQLGFSRDVTGDPNIGELAAVWRTCILADIPAEHVTSTPFTMPTDTDAVSFGLHELNLSQEPPEVSEDERALATADAECRDSSGFSELVYSTLWNAEMELVEQNRAVLTEEARVAREQVRNARAFALSNRE